MKLAEGECCGDQPLADISSNVQSHSWQLLLKNLKTQADFNTTLPPALMWTEGINLQLLTLPPRF